MITYLTKALKLRALFYLALLALYGCVTPTTAPDGQGTCSAQSPQNPQNPQNPQDQSHCHGDDDAHHGSSQEDTDPIMSGYDD